MFIEVIKNNGYDYLRLSDGYRCVDGTGKKTVRKKVILNIGSLKKFDDGKPNYLNRLKESFKAGNPLIESLKPFCEKKQALETYNFSYKEQSPDCFGETKLCSNILLDKILEELGLNTFFASYKSFTKIEFDVYAFFKLLVFGRILNPASKSATIEQNNNYFDSILPENYNPYNIYDTLDFIYENKSKITKRINTHLVQNSLRKTDLIFYDVTNFYFEIDDPDTDTINSNNEIVEKGFRSMGVSKEERSLPIVQVGLFMDNNGLPIAIETFPGNTLDHLTFKKSLKKNISELELSRFILVADRGMYSLSNLIKVLNSGNGYIVSKSLLKSKKEDKDWAYSNKNWNYESKDFKYKSRIVENKVKDENGIEYKVNEKIVVYWSKKFEDRDIREHKKFLEFIDKLIASPNNFKITAIQYRSLKKFFKKDVVNKKTGEIFKDKDIIPLLDMDKIKAFKEGMGFYQIASSELNLSEKEIIEKYHGLSEIENQFRIMKSTLDTRPIFVRTKEHITAHLFICMIALLIIRIIQNKIMATSNEAKRNAKEKKLNWSMGLSADKIQNALNLWQTEKMSNEYYRFLNITNENLSLIFNTFNIKLTPKFYRLGEIKQIKGTIQIFK